MKRSILSNGTDTNISIISEYFSIENIIRRVFSDLALDHCTEGIDCTIRVF